MHPKLADHEWLKHQYLALERSSVQIAEDLGVLPQSVQHQLKRAGVKMRGRWSGRWTEKKCEHCEAAYTPSGPAALFCSDRCRLVHMHGLANCKQCGEEFVPRPSSKKVRPQEFCSRRCWYDFKTAATPTIYVRDDGYVRHSVPSGTPGRGRDGRMPEHRYVMQEALGRPLDPTETVHHINGDKADNRLENLQLRRGRHGKGVVMACLDCGSHNVGAVPIS